MAMHASRLTQDQNFSVHFDGVKTNGSTVQKNRGGRGGRKALNDISNSGKPSALQPSRKHNTKNVIPIGEDLGVSKKTQVPVGGKTQYVIKPPEKAQVSGRKALSDLTNSVKSLGQQQGLKKRSQEKKSIAVAEDGNIPYSIAEECFLHNHQECVKSQKTAIDLDQFLKTIGLDEDVSGHFVSTCNLLPRKSKGENPMKLFEMEELSEPIIEDRPPQSHKPELLLSGQSSPICGSPNSPRMPYLNMMDYDDFPSFILAETPRRSK